MELSDENASDRDRQAGAPGRALTKAPTGIRGLDEISEGGLPAGRPTLVCGAAGCGKTLLAVEFLVRGATEFGEPGVFMMFEESAEELSANVRSMGFDLQRLQQQGLLVLDHVRIERGEIEEAGDYDLEGLFIRLGHAIDTVGARRVVLDTLESLFTELPDQNILRAELRRLFRWLKDRGVTAVITGERGDGALTRYGLEEYVADCVILLDHRVDAGVSTRRMRIVKYRGSAHSTNEYPFMIARQGLSVLPITSLRLDHAVSQERVPTGIGALDRMLGGKGIYRGSSVLLSGSAGSGKSSVVATMIDAACRRGDRTLLFAFEESSSQFRRNMASIGIRLDAWLDAGLLQIHALRPTLHGLEQHLMMMHDAVDRFEPTTVAIDPISNLSLDRTDAQVELMLMRLIDYLKQRQVTALFTDLVVDVGPLQPSSQIGVSSLMDTWIALANRIENGERVRTIEVLKSRGMAHSNQVREFVLGDGGFELIDICLAGDRVVTGRSRIAHAQRTSDAATAGAVPAIGVRP